MAERAVYIATAEALDTEMAERIAKHKSRRGSEWRTVSEPRDLVRALRDTDGEHPRLVDCLTLWLSNVMLSDGDWHGEAAALADALPGLEAPVVLVSNEVGAGIVPENRLARDFRDAAGQVNQMIAAVCDEVYLTVAGYPVKVKPNDIVP